MADMNKGKWLGKYSRISHGAFMALNWKLTHVENLERFFTGLFGFRISRVH